MTELPEYVVVLLNQIAVAENLTNYTIDLTVASKEGENFLGVIRRAILRGQRNGIPAELHLIIKLTLSNESRRKEFIVDQMFQREVLVYKKILPMLEKFQRDRGLTADESFLSFPKCYAAIADQQTNRFVVIMEDLRVKNFLMLAKDKPIASDHIFLVVEQLAKMHAVSFAIKDQQPTLYAQLRKVHDLFRCLFKSDSMKSMIESPVDRAIEVLENPNHIEWLQDFRANLHEERRRCLADDAGDPFSVIGHGDFWSNNILFQYNGDDVS